MALTREDYGRDKPIIVTCDRCGEQLNTGCSSLADATVGARSMGWAIEKINGMWLQSCRLCETGDKNGRQSVS